MAKLTMTTRPDKVLVNNSGDKAIGVTLSLDQIMKAEPFSSLFMIKHEVLAAITEDMKAHGFDPSKPVNVWKKADGTRILIDGYTRVRAAEALGLLHITAYEKTFASEAEALAYAIHTQRDRRNLSDVEILRLVQLIDRPQTGFKKSLTGNELLAISANEPSEGAIRSTSELTAEALGISNAKVKRARAVLADTKQAASVLAGEKTIHKAAQDAKAERDSMPKKSSASSNQCHHSKAAFLTEEDALSEGHRILLLLNALSAADPNEIRRAAYRSTTVMVRRALK